MLKDLLNTQALLEPHLLPDDYSFIGPEDTSRLESFCKSAISMDPHPSFYETLDDVLAKKHVVEKVLSLSSSNLPLRIYVVTKNDSPFMLHTTVEDYCKKNNITLDTQ